MGGELLRYKHLLVQNAAGKWVNAISDVHEASRKYESATCFNTVGDDDSDGTKLCSITIEDDEIFICTDALASVETAAMLKLVISTTDAVGGTETEKYFIDCRNTGLNGESKDYLHPIFVYENKSGSTVYALLYAPETGFGGADDGNNDASHYFTAKIGGYIEDVS